MPEDLDSLLAQTETTSKTKPETGPIAYLKNLVERSGKKMMAKQARIEQNPLKSLLQEVGNVSMTPISPLSIARVIREQFGGETPAAFEKMDPSLAGWARGGAELIQAPAQMIANVLPGQIGQDVNQSVDATKRYFDETFRPDVIGPMQAKALPFVATGGATGAPTSGNVLMQMLMGGTRGAAQGAAISGLTEPVYGAQSGQDVLRGKLQQAATGAKFGGAVGTLAPGVGRLLSGKAKYNVSNLGEELRTKGTDITSDMKIADDLIASGDKDIAKRAEILKDSLMNAGDNLPARQQLSLQLNELQDKAVRNAVYAVRDKAATEAGVSVDQQPIISVIDKSIEKAAKGVPDETSINTLKKIRNRLDRETDTPSPFGFIGNSFTDMSSLRSDLGDIVRKAYVGENSLTGSKGASLFQPVKDVVADVMHKAAQEAGSNVSVLDEAANAAHRAYKTKWNWNVLKNAVESETPDTFFPQFATKKSSDLASGISGAMTPGGNEATKALMFEKAMTESGGDPLKFVKSFKSMADSSGVFFTGDDAEKLKGFMKIMSASGSLGEGTATLGGAAAGYAMGGGYGALGGAFAPKAIGVIGLGGDKTNLPGLLSKAYSKLLMTQAGQDLLLRAKDASAKELPALWDQLPKIVSITNEPTMTPRQQTPAQPMAPVAPQEPSLDELLSQYEPK